MKFFCRRGWTRRRRASPFPRPLALEGRGAMGHSCGGGDRGHWRERRIQPLPPFAEGESVAASAVNGCKGVVDRLQVERRVRLSTTGVGVFDRGRSPHEARGSCGECENRRRFAGRPAATTCVSHRNPSFPGTLRRLGTEGVDQIRGRLPAEDVDAPDIVLGDEDD